MAVCTQISLKGSTRIVPCQRDKICLLALIQLNTHITQFVRDTFDVEIINCPSASHFGSNHKLLICL